MEIIKEQSPQDKLLTINDVPVGKTFVIDGWNSVHLRINDGIVNMDENTFRGPGEWRTDVCARIVQSELKVTL
ncbi:hypothetical protein RU59_00012 [Enterobacter phage phiEap-1]|uniref:Uncharacterized protein n=1 Tax=Enterobacter phage phiEap-1 TaxID=1587520 RepID=A0A0K2FGA0_9CAUD|nr:hypothetical protein RU59_00012 [Enterobacter phage phiEap-1]ALA45075.1 hypothetical protein RU59_00012 [Enterobacter phage phiEap-1]